MNLQMSPKELAWMGAVRFDNPRQAWHCLPKLKKLTSSFRTVPWPRVKLSGSRFEWLVMASKWLGVTRVFQWNHGGSRLNGTWFHQIHLPFKGIYIDQSAYTYVLWTDFVDMFAECCRGFLSKSLPSLENCVFFKMICGCKERTLHRFFRWSSNWVTFVGSSNGFEWLNHPGIMFRPT